MTAIEQANQIWAREERRGRIALVQAGAPLGNKNAAKFTTGQTVRFDGRAADGRAEGMFEVEIVNPHSNSDKVTHTDNRGRQWAGAFTHLPTATVKNKRSGNVFEAHHYTLRGV